MRKYKYLIALSLMIFMALNVTSAEGKTSMTLTIVYDNYALIEETKPDWGFSCFIKGTEKNILFDTGTQGHILLDNMDALEIHADVLDIVFLSHNHHDHTGGLNSILDRKTSVPVYFGDSFPAEFAHEISRRGAMPVRVNKPVRICKDVFSTGEIKGPVDEQSLILDTESGLVIITGCSHPGIVKILEKAKEVLDKDIYLVLGGFHLFTSSDVTVNHIIEKFKDLGVKKCGPTHCTGDRAITLFRKAFGSDFVPMGVGQVINVK